MVVGHETTKRKGLYTLGKCTQTMSCAHLQKSGTTTNDNLDLHHTWATTTTSTMSHDDNECCHVTAQNNNNNNNNSSSKFLRYVFLLLFLFYFTDRLLPLSSAKHLAPWGHL